MRLPKIERARVSSFVPGQSAQTILLRFDIADIDQLSAVVQHTGEYYVDDAVRSILMAVSTMPPSQLMGSREMLLTLRSQYARRVASVIKQKLKEADAALDEEIMQFLVERGIDE